MADQNTSQHKQPILRVDPSEAEELIKIQLNIATRIYFSYLESYDYKKMKAAFGKWDKNNIDILYKIFDNDYYVMNYKSYYKPIGLIGGIIKPSVDKLIEDLKKHLSAKRNFLQIMIDYMIPLASEEGGKTENLMKTFRKDIFIVHGHDEAAKQAVARFLEKLNLNTIILHEKPDKGRTIIEKFEDYSDVGFAIILLTPDDMGYKNGEPGEVKPRARQNVIFELGYFIGKLGRGNVCALYKEGIELPSDIQGVLYVQMDLAEGWHMKLAREIKHAGIEVDLNKVI